MPELTEAFYDLFTGMPRQGPGDAASTAKALSMIPRRQQSPKILDVGCGSGTQTLDLARLTDATIVAVDNYAPLLERLQGRAEAEGFGKRITVVSGDMSNLPFADKEFDVIWSEGAIFVIGFEKGLKEWKRFLKPGGYMAVTEAAWFKLDPPQELLDFWNHDYPAITSIDENLRMIKEAGYAIVGHFTLPDSSWWNDYYAPMEVRIPVMRKKYAGDAEAFAVFDAAETEIDLHRKYSEYYGYVFFVMRVL